MVGTSKILTVSYGTFSCTLEGFDDPFSTMRGIAEYFRDLAADDRYFGAEPPTPDADMLHRIAEREINRRVIAKVEGSGVTLRQMDDSEDEAGESPAQPEAESTPRKKKKKKDKSRARALALAAQSPEPTPDAEPTAAPTRPEAETAAEPQPAEAPESFAAKMLRIRAAVARSAAADAFVEEPQSEEMLGFKPISSAFEDAPAEKDAEVEAEPAAEQVEPVEEAEAPAETADTDIEAPEAVEAAQPVTDADDSDAETALAEAMVEAEAQAEADAAELETSMAVEAAAAAATEAELEIEAVEMEEASNENTDGFEDEDSDDTEVASGDVDLADLISRVSESADSAGPDEVEVQTSVTVMASAEVTVLPEQDADIQTDNEVEPEDEPAPAPRLVRARVIKMRKPSIDRETEDFPDTETAPEADELAPMPVLSDDRDTDEEDESGEATDEDGLFSIADAVARAVQDVDDEDEAEDDKDTSLFFDAEDEAGADDEDDDIDLLAESPEEITDITEEAEAVEADVTDDFEAPVTLTGSTLPDEEEASLLAELAEVEAENAGTAEAEEDAAGTEAANTDGDDQSERLTAQAAEDHAAFEEAISAADTPRRNREGKSLLDKTYAGDDDASVRRILDETNSQLDDTEASRRRSTIAHLKAAVAATRADRDENGEAIETDEDMSQYRNDLERVVRPRRPGERATGTTRRLAPLMLVSEQRIDLPNLEVPSESSVRPRRITTGNLALMEDDELADDEFPAEGKAIADSISFEEYAEKMAATELPDVLEAAAAYAAFVEGRPHFSRPQLMKAAMQATGGAFSREDGLRSFGTLLRTGKIQKIKRGQFTIAKNSRFRPEGAHH
ncbi:hypothetical protein [Frigidibacter sp. ROC022]|uniref:hypothetical protein n=1 Tax=Frigidibacter sp. ROC022 TaxID=2971796 RepID=UPI00215B2569|nr:hypothetical protein [Frigidibacter sp. ROC022]MCR8725280.1 hypothetical protein [Frigidibacter sp. ROC022]